jgi:biotin operon repressor
MKPSYKDYDKRIEILKQSILDSKTGNPDELAEKLGISRRTVFRNLEALRDKGNDIRFSKIRNTYYCKTECGQRGLK